MKIELIKSFHPHHAGEVLEVEDFIGEHFIMLGVARKEGCTDCEGKEEGCTDCEEKKTKAKTK